MNMKNGVVTPSISEKRALPYQRFDITAKDPVYMFPEDMLGFLIPGAVVEFLEHLESELITVEKRQMDSLIKVRLDGKVVLVHCEFQTGDSRHLDMVRRTVGYLGRCYERYGLPIFSHVIYLHPDAGVNDPGGYVQEIAGYRFIVEYKVIRLIKEDGASYLRAQQPGLIPFCALMKPPAGTDSLQWLYQCVETAKSLSLDAPVRNNLLVDLWVMGGLIHPSEAIADLLAEDIMQDSSVYQQITEKARAEGVEQGLERGLEQGLERGLEQGLERGAKENTIESILMFLEDRLENVAIEVLKPALEAIDDLPRLRSLLREAAKTESLEAFIIHLANGGQ